MEFPPEYQRAYALLLCCARAHWDLPYEERGTQLIQDGVSWDDLIWLAEFHGVWPMVYENLTKICRDTLPDAVDDRLRRRTHATATHGVFLTKELGRLLTLFEARGLPALSFKGPVLAQIAYGDIKRRPCLDLDILVPRTQYQEATRLLIEDGYIPHEKVAKLSGIQEQMYLWLARQYPFRRGASVFNIDLHIDIMPPLYGYDVGFETLWQRAELFRVGGETVRSFEVEDHLQILCYHGAKNRWEALKYVCDVAELIQSFPGLDWSRLAERARRTKGERILYLGLYLAHTLLDAAVPSDVLAYALRQPRVQPVAESVIQRLPGQIRRGVAGFGERFRFHLATQDTWGGKLRYGSIALVRRGMGLLQPGTHPV